MRLQKLIQNKKLQKIGGHIVFWFLAILFYILFFSRITQEYYFSSIFVLFLLPVFVTTAYIFTEKIIPDYLLKKRYGLFVLFSVYAVIISLWAQILSVFLIWIKISNYDPNGFRLIRFDAISLIAGNYFIIFVAVIKKLVKHAFDSQKSNAEIMQKQMQTELELRNSRLSSLKAQLHPHFLFNTLNNLYGLSYEKSDKTPDLILKLSEMLDYMLYRTNSANVLLTEEIQSLQNFIEIEKIRFGEKIDLRFHVSGKTNGVEVAPLILLPFVENAFKHASAEKKSKIWVDIDLQIENDKLMLKVANTKKAVSEKKHLLSGGIGIENVKKRLELVYPKQHELTIREETNLYEIKLQLNTKADVQLHNH